MIIKVEMLVQTDDELIVRDRGIEVRHPNLVVEDIENMEDKHFSVILIQAQAVESIAEVFEKELEHIINKYSKENGSNTPDFIIAKYIVGCLDAMNNCIRERDTWYNRDKE
jgi:hypothetical protein